jgi:hypothetical protein
MLGIKYSTNGEEKIHTEKRLQERRKRMRMDNIKMKPREMSWDFVD